MTKLQQKLEEQGNGFSVKQLKIFGIDKAYNIAYLKIQILNTDMQDGTHSVVQQIRRKIGSKYIQEVNVEI